MDVFVTGHRGYIGVHLVDVLQRAGHRVTGCDAGLFDGCEWEPFAAPELATVGHELVLIDHPKLSVVQLDKLVSAEAVRIERNPKLPPEMVSAIREKGTVP